MWRRLAPLALAITLAGCGGSSSPTPTPPPGGGGNTIRGTERIGWDQPSSSAGELGGLRYALYVDGSRSEIADVSCANSASAAGFACSGRMPPMSPGAHTLELASFIVTEGGIVESPRSAPLQVTVSPGATAGATSEPLRIGSPSNGEPPARRPAAEQAAALAEGFDDIVDLAAAGRTRLLVAERRGALHLIDRLRGVREGAVVLEGTRAAGEAGALASVAADPNFEASGHVYVLQTTIERDGPAWQVSRYRVAGGRFGERAVLVRLRGAPQADAPGTLRIGDDDRLYLALAGRYRDDRPGEGYVLRMNRDGSVPHEDGDPAAPLWATTAHPPAGLAWHEAEAVWTAEAPAGLSGRLLALRSRSAREDGGTAASMGAIGVVHRVASGRGRRSSLPDGILVAAESGLYLARPQVDTAAAVMERLFDGPVRAAAVAGSGAIVVATSDRVLVLGRH